MRGSSGGGGGGVFDIDDDNYIFKIGKSQRNDIRLTI